jgi:hypothetical protein
MVCRDKLRGSPRMELRQIKPKGERTDDGDHFDWSKRNITLGSFSGGAKSHRFRYVIHPP